MSQYLPAVVWTVILLYELTQHVQVYRVYSRQLHLLRAMEGGGGVVAGSEIVAINLRVRYAIRCLLAALGILIGIGGVIGVYNPAFAQSSVFNAFVLAYFFGSEIATGYLTIRDKRVINKLLAIDAAEVTGHDDTGSAIGRMAHEAE